MARQGCRRSALDSSLSGLYYSKAFQIQEMKNECKTDRIGRMTVRDCWRSAARPRRRGWATSEARITSPSLVRPENFDAAGDVFTRKLGFAATPALLSPLGAKNRLIWFRDRSYLEIATFTERNEFTAQFLDFLEDHEGAKFYGTAVADAGQTIDFLTGAGYPNAGPIPAPPLTIESTGEMVGLTPLWNSIVLTARVAPDNSNFLAAI